MRGSHRALGKQTGHSVDSLCASALREAAVGLAITDATQTKFPVLACNPAFIAMCGYPGDVVGKWTSEQLIGEDTPPSARRQVLEALQHGGQCRAITQQRRGDGIPYWAELTLSTIHAETGAAQGHIWVFRDITQQVAMDELWRRYEFIVNTAGDLLGLIRDNYTYAAVNSAFAAAFQITVEEAEERPVKKLWGAADFYALITGPMEHCFAGAESHAEGWFDFPGLGRRYVDINYYPYRNTEGTVTHAVEVVRDTTHRKAAEDAVIRLNLELEGRVVERTRQLQDVVRELDAFNYTVAHDLRTPLHAIQTLIRLLRRECKAELPPTGEEYIDLIGRGVQQLDTMIGDLLRLSRLGRQQVNVSEVNMRALAEESVKLLHHEYPEHRAEITVGNLPSCKGDPGLLREVLVNLISNALKFTSNRRRPRIVIDATTKGGEIVYFVKDNGIGFTPSESELLFSVFKRLDSAEEFEGNGVGLAIVRRIIERHGGRVWAKGSPNRGATVYFTSGAKIAS